MRAVFSHTDSPLWLSTDAATDWRRPRRHGKTRRPLREVVPAPRERAPRPAAGILCRYTDTDGVWYLMARRAARLGGTWANVGGSLEPGEDVLAGALREFHEELDLPASVLLGATIGATIECGTDRVPYTLFVLDVPRCFDNAVLSWENTELWWVLADEVPTLPLHSGFARAWAQLHPTPEGVLS